MKIFKLKNYGLIPLERKLKTTLNKTEIDIANLLGQQKAAIKRNAIKSHMKDTPENHALTYKAEMAFCKIMNIAFRPIIDPNHNFTNDDGDAIWCDLNVDVKHSIYSNPNLAVQSYKESDNTDIYALVTGVENTFIYQGAILKKDLFVKENLGNGPKGFENAYCIKAEKLNYYYYDSIK